MGIFPTLIYSSIDCFKSDSTPKKYHIEGICPDEVLYYKDII